MDRYKGENIYNFKYYFKRVISLEFFKTIFKLNGKENHYYKGEAHDYYELVFLTKGRARIIKGNKTYTIHPNEMVLHPPMEFHSICADGIPFTAIIITFGLDGDVINPLADKIFELTPELKKTFMSIFYELNTAFTYGANYHVAANSGSFLDENIATLKFEAFLLDILAHTRSIVPDKNNLFPKYTSVITIMEDNIDKNLSVPEIAKLSSMSISSLNRLFKAITGYGVAEHYTRLKLVRACNLLKTGKNICEVSDILGFSSPSYFSRTFSRYMGFPPKELKG